LGLFKRKKEAEGDDALRLYYASDIHGTEVLWKKFLNAPKVYDARVLVMGGDITGKVVIPIVQEDDGTWSARLFGGRQRARDEAELDGLERRVRGNGMYPYRTTHAEVDRIAGLPEEQREQWFESVMLHTFGEWIKLADERLAGTGIRCFVMPGNDDPQALEDCIRQGVYVESCDEAVEVCASADPDVVLVDYRMPGRDGAQTTTAIRAASPRARVVCLTASISEAEVELILAAGAVSCVTKDQDLDRIVAAIHEAAALTSST